MSPYFFLRYGIVALAFAGWILYQMYFKKKRFQEIKGDALAIAFFVVIGGSIYYWLLT